VSKPLQVRPNPCSTCPYAVETPSGVWSPEEYEKLRLFDDQHNPRMATFLCHHSPMTEADAICRGWLTVHRKHPMVRVLILRGAITADEVYREPTVELYESGTEAADAGEMNIGNPGPRARKAIAKLLRQKGVRHKRERPPETSRE